MEKDLENISDDDENIHILRSDSNNASDNDYMDNLESYKQLIQKKTSIFAEYESMKDDMNSFILSSSLDFINRPPDIISNLPFLNLPENISNIQLSDLKTEDVDEISDNITKLEAREIIESEPEILLPEIEIEKVIYEEENLNKFDEHINMKVNALINTRKKTLCLIRLGIIMKSKRNSQKI